LFPIWAQSYDLDGVGSIPAMLRRRLPALLIISINKNVCLFFPDLGHNVCICSRFGGTTLIGRILQQQDPMSPMVLALMAPADAAM
jgi:hypothetical protein